MRLWTFRGGLNVVPDTRPLAGRTTKRQQEARDSIRSFLQGLPEGASFTEIHQATGLSNRLMYEVLAEMGAGGELLPRKARGRYLLAREVRAA